MAAEWTMIFVKPGFSQWNVREKSMERPTAYFTSKEEAVKYAVAFARTRTAAVVQVLDERGDVVSEQRFTLERYGTAQGPVRHAQDGRKDRNN